MFLLIQLVSSLTKYGTQYLVFKEAHTIQDCEFIGLNSAFILLLNQLVEQFTYSMEALSPKDEITLKSYFDDLEIILEIILVIS
jgi:hypothetical protein